jgi:hypothetical protein
MCMRGAKGECCVREGQNLAKSGAKEQTEGANDRATMSRFSGPACEGLHHLWAGIGVARRRSSGGSLVLLVGGGALRAGCPPKAAGQEVRHLRSLHGPNPNEVQKGKMQRQRGRSCEGPSPLPARPARVQAGGAV